MPGGQSGLSWLGENNVLIIGGTVGLLLVTQLWLGCIGMPGSQGAGDDAMSSYDQACRQEYADANDGNDDTKVETAILEQPDCRAVIITMKAKRAQAQRDAVQEAQP